ncbi:ribonuclease P protein component [Aquabacterium sp. A7-Y]|uniref:ribonuclease P protein component n=1 Tax=Aquabacterium sp. A7-Y TaxID=1349605 RepID=UPI00223E53FB|nr:ribonuclease P protein component [Aquabacterium sp. A7-Y]MCW7538413.1 ribonuclease P protein component [Aquabacterium sp. A7-Y]
MTGPASMRRLKQKADFERALGAGSPAVVARSAHFVVHFVPPADPAERAAPQPVPEKLSTGPAPELLQAVDVSPVTGSGALRRSHLALVGTVLPKRWARRSVTRSLLKRQVFAAFERVLPTMPSGVWVVRLRAAFDRKQFPSAASDALRDAARAELDGLLKQAGPRAARSLSSKALAPAP